MSTSARMPALQRGVLAAKKITDMMPCTEPLPAPPQVPLQVLTERAIAHYYYNEAGRPDQVAWDVSTSMYPHPTTDSINIGAKAHACLHACLPVS